MTVKFDLYGEFGDADQDFYWLSDAEKLRLLADWFDLQDELRGHDEGTDVQDDLRRMAWEMEQEEDYQESVFWIATVMVLVVVLILVLLF